MYNGLVLMTNFSCAKLKRKMLILVFYKTMLTGLTEKKIFSLCCTVINQRHTI